MKIKYFEFKPETEKFVPGQSRLGYGGAMIGQEEVDALLDVVTSQGGRRWTVGPESEALEKELAEVAQTKYAILTNSGSSALLISIAALKLPKGSKILVPACNFPTAFNSIVQNGHIPVVVDVDLNTLNINLSSVEKAIEQYPEIKAVVAVNIAGNPVDLIRLKEIVNDRKVILDDCDGFGTTLKGKMVETLADVACASFHAAHILSMGEGGAVFTNDEVLAKSAKKMREWGRASGTDDIYDYPGFPPDYKERYVYEEVGYNMKPLELQCAIGRVQLKKLWLFKTARENNYARLMKIFSQYPKYFDLVTCDLDAKPCWFSFPVSVKEGKRGELMSFLEGKNIECRTIFSGNILRHPAYKNIETITVGTLDNSDKIMHEGMFISCHPSLDKAKLDYIADCIKEFVK